MSRLRTAVRGPELIRTVTKYRVSRIRSRITHERIYETRFKECQRNPEE
ncbi:MAG: hypothetical protein FJY85_13830 [Deltaproteobacteria bacterium]|nr:hypothetical protein [Deltaproteobacteria bacterium]